MIFSFVFMFSRNITVFEISAVASVVHDAIFKARKFIFHYFHRIILTVHAMAGFCGEVWGGVGRCAPPLRIFALPLGKVSMIDQSKNLTFLVA